MGKDDRVNGLEFVVVGHTNPHPKVSRVKNSVSQRKHCVVDKDSCVRIISLSFFKTTSTGFGRVSR